MRMTREIGIDMGHRVALHASKCKNLHGHRYTIQATVAGDLEVQGEEDGMVMDFGFLKDMMMRQIDDPCDHGTCLWVDDPTLVHTLGPEYEVVKSVVDRQGYCPWSWAWGKLYVVGFTPTAENLAKHWFERLTTRVDEHCDGRAHLVSIKVWETPNGSAEYTLDT